MAFCIVAVVSSPESLSSSLKNPTVDAGHHASFPPARSPQFPRYKRSNGEKFLASTGRFEPHHKQGCLQEVLQWTEESLHHFGSVY